VVQEFKNYLFNYNAMMRVRTGVSINNAAKSARERLETLKIPILILHGAEDKVVNPSGSEVVFAQASSVDKTLKMYAGLRHEIMNEPERDQVLGDILAWLEQHIAQ
jgi:alpha-beta hydrolase superfamily lysophospholipase